MTESFQSQDDLDHYKEKITNQEKEIQTLHAEVDLLSSDLAMRKELNSDLEIQVQNLEKKVHAAEEKAQTAAHKLKLALNERKDLSDQVEEINC